jgi:23S rRNA (guanosine2251-2'-O)-methyltransferase
MAKRKPPKGPKSKQSHQSARPNGPRRGRTRPPGATLEPRAGQGPDGAKSRPSAGSQTSAGSGSGAGQVWLYGYHAVRAALANPRRRFLRLVLSPEVRQRHGTEFGALNPSAAAQLQTAERTEWAEILGPDAVHQGLAALVAPLQQPDLSEVLSPIAGIESGPRPMILVLDQVTDPHNVGAILRSAAAFGARAVVSPTRHSASETGTLAKAASGALEVTPLVEVSNLARALQQMKDAGFWILGLAGEAERTLAETDPGGPVGIVLGAEGPGLRRLTRESCDLLARLPTRPPIGSLNVSNAAAVALYALTTKSV